MPAPHPSRLDQENDLTAEHFATEFEGFPEIIEGVSQARMLIATGRLVRAFVVYGLLAADGIHRPHGVELDASVSGAHRCRFAGSFCTTCPAWPRWEANRPRVSRGERADRDDRDAIGSHVAVSSPGDDAEDRRLPALAGVYRSAEPEQRLGTRVHKTGTELDLERPPSAVGELHDGVDLELGIHDPRQVRHPWAPFRVRLSHHIVGIPTTTLSD